ncbi:GNAT family N-acetyltransferase [uncultured Roseibium sp.]|uniref:GNAT family N-acetyltransferase n=1 Tax=uncultured Roseibium sp. TaxID=1936171 RepID=UPI00260BB1ED|nr:GNAT family N-acetyltransferase [uncultured Roseibium sp.]
MKLAGSGFEIRSAEGMDAAEIAAVLRRSIAELCVADHNNDPERLGSWLRNKTEETALGWIEGPGQVLVAVSQGSDRQLLGVGMALPAGEVVLNYVDPSARYQGVSKALMWSLESYFTTIGVTHVSLRSTLTAERFYRSIGYVQSDIPLDPGDRAAAIFEKDLHP